MPPRKKSSKEGCKILEAEEAKVASRFRTKALDPHLSRVHRTRAFAKADQSIAEAIERDQVDAKAVSVTRRKRKANTAAEEDGKLLGEQFETNRTQPRREAPAKPIATSDLLSPSGIADARPKARPRSRLKSRSKSRLEPKPVIHLTENSTPVLVQDIEKPSRAGAVTRAQSRAARDLEQHRQAETFEAKSRSLLGAEVATRLGRPAGQESKASYIGRKPSKFDGEGKTLVHQPNRLLTTSQQRPRTASQTTKPKECEEGRPLNSHEHRDLIQRHQSNGQPVVQPRPLGTKDRAQRQKSLESRITPWLDAVQTETSPPTDDDMSSSTVADISTPPLEHSAGPSTIKEMKKSKAKDKLTEELFLMKLQLMNIEVQRVSHDPMKDEIREKAWPSAGVSISLTEIGQLKQAAKDFIDDCDEPRPDDNYYAVIETFRTRFNKHLSLHPINTITTIDFDKDIEHAIQSNEAVFQRTVMLSAIDRWHLPGIFSYDCESLWHTSDMTRLRSAKGKDDDSRKRPDLVVCFSRLAMRGEMDPAFMIPDNFWPCVSPSRDIERCFPFIIIEAKRAHDTIHRAKHDCLHRASQALHNIYMCMSKVQEERLFFDDVRVFSIALNASQMSARIHRAAISKQSGMMRYHFDNICTNETYNRDKISLLIRTILLDYAESKLFDILKGTYQKLAGFNSVSAPQDDVEALEQASSADSEPSKRKTDAAPSASKRARIMQSTPGEDMNTGLSFGTSQVDLVS